MTVALVVLLALIGLISAVHAEDPYHFFEWHVSYGTLSPFGVPQKVILINNEFPGPVINCSSNNNIVVNVFNNLGEPFLFTWNGIQQRKNSWMDGMPGTNCPILPGTNFTYKFQVKDQIGSYFYFPSIGMQKAAGGYGLLRVNSRLLIPVPFDEPADDYTVLVGDWYARDHTFLAKMLDAGRSIKLPIGVLINGKSGLDEDKKAPPMFTMEPGKTYRYRICNTGIKATINIRIQDHGMKLVEMDGSHTVQNVYGSLDVHVGQCVSVLVTADQAVRDYYLVASTRFLKKVFTTTAVIGYEGSETPPAEELPAAPTGWAWSFNQWRTFRWNLTASAARPNPQGSYHYGDIPIARTIKLVNQAGPVNGKKRYGFNGVSHIDNGGVPLKLAEYFNVSDRVFEYNLIDDSPPPVVVNEAPMSVAPNVITAEFRTFIEIIFQNPDKTIQSYHLDGYSFFPAGMGPGKWTPECRKMYNDLDTVSRHSIQVFPKSWTAILLTFDNAGMWNLRSNVWERNYLGQQLYVSMLSPARSLRDEYNMHDSTLLCGFVKDLPLPEPYVQG